MLVPNLYIKSFLKTTGHKQEGKAAEGPGKRINGDPGGSTPLKKVFFEPGEFDINPTRKLYKFIMETKFKQVFLKIYFKIGKTLDR